ncbi:hypothetical protein SAMN04487950_3493 [Halogranum rubrum]|uniref:Uncharacterized protein n=1 Tax=Halogranum rubrum TaxID=553466 RepID=A0A1I4GYK8_9EURY|nr:hypothetical protein [Halogranum rubrum]SFL35039.1 hypothetical protein SAMN04487950_3493 [Halogranum rubrum]
MSDRLADRLKEIGEQNDPTLPSDPFERYLYKDEVTFSAFQYMLRNPTQSFSRTHVGKNIPFSGSVLQQSDRWDKYLEHGMVERVETDTPWDEYVVVEDSPYVEFLRELYSFEE